MTKEVEIMFGTTFTLREDKVSDATGQEHVVLDVGEGNIFQTAEVLKTPQGKLAIAGGGTTREDMVKALTGQLSFQEVLDGFRRAHGTLNRITTSAELAEPYLKESSKKKPRKIKLTS
jgi:hypothetical protein